MDSDISIVSYPTIGNDELAGRVNKGRQLNQRILCSRDELSIDFGDGDVVRATILENWYTEIPTPQAALQFTAVSRALGNLIVGKPAARTGIPDNDFLAARNVNTNVFPNGQNIPITVDRKLPSEPGNALNLRGRRTYKLVFNVLDGLIIISDMQSQVDLDNETLQGDASYVYAREFAEVTSALWKALHTRSAHYPKSRKEEITELRNAVGLALQSDSALPELRFEDVYAWLPVALTTRWGCDKVIGKVPELRVFTVMKNWLNFILVQAKFSDNMWGVINHCLSVHGIPDGWAYIWDGRLTLPIGHWGFYALLSTDIGSQVVLLLARNKSENCFGQKLIRSITIFAPDEIVDLPVSDREMYNTSAVLLFELGDDGDGVRAEAQNTEHIYGKPPQQLTPFQTPPPALDTDAVYCSVGERMD